MTTTQDFGEYTGLEGSLTVGGLPIADVFFDCKWARGGVGIPRSGKHSDKELPGKLTQTTKIRKALVHEDAPVLLGYSLNDTPITGSAGTLLATSHVLDAGDAYEDMTTPTIATESRVKYTLQTKNLTVAGTITIIGEDTAGNAISETIEVPATMLIAETLISSKVYKKVHGHTIRAVDSTDDLGTFKVESIIGSSTLTVGNPKVFDLVGSVTKGSKSITVTLIDCWFKNGGLAWTDVGKTVDVDADVGMYDPDELECVIVG